MPRRTPGESVMMKVAGRHRAICPSLGSRVGSHGNAFRALTEYRHTEGRAHRLCTGAPAKKARVQHDNLDRKENFNGLIADVRKAQHDKSRSHGNLGKMPCKQRSTHDRGPPAEAIDTVCSHPTNKLTLRNRTGQGECERAHEEKCYLGRAKVPLARGKAKEKNAAGNRLGHRRPRQP